MRSSYCGTLKRMDMLGFIKPLLTTLVLPPTGLLLLLFLGLLMGRRRRRLARAMVWSAGILCWVLSCQATAYGLNRWLLPSYAPVSASQRQQAQAIVVLGGGVNLYAPEYGVPSLNAHAQARLQYAALLKQQTGLPLLFAGGKGWAAAQAQVLSEAEVAAAALRRDTGTSIDWLDTASRDTKENALRAFDTLAPLNKTRILLVTNDWHMARSVKQFEKAGFKVIPAPMGYLQPPQNRPFDYLPSPGGMGNTQLLLKEWLGGWLT